MSLEPTFYGYVATSNDALLIFEAARSNGILSKVSRRPHDRERDRLIKSGNIFVFDEHSSGIRRWTDGVAWSPSRILGNYLIYRQLERPLQPGEKKRAQKHRLSNGGQRAGSDQPGIDSPERLKSDLTPVRTPSPREAGGPIRSHSKKVKSDSSSNASDNGSISNKPRRWSEEQEKELAGSLTDSYGFKEGGLIKKTMSVEYEGTVHHLVSYYTIDDVMLSRLPQPSQDPRLADLPIGSDLMTRTNFRVHPSSEAGNTVSRNSPTQQRTQMLLQHQRRNDDPRHGSGYGPMNYNAPPPVHGNAPPEGYPDPNNHYAYGPGPQPPHYGRGGYFPPQPSSYQLPMFMHGAPPPQHIVNTPYYGPPPQGPPPQYPPGPPQHAPHQQVEVKREGPNQQYYGGYNPYPQPNHQPNNQAPMYSGHYPPRGPPPQQQQQPQMVAQGQRPYETGYQQGGQPENRGAGPAPPQQQPPQQQ
jgi:Gti1/Pac2 family transcription factor